MQQLHTKRALRSAKIVFWREGFLPSATHKIDLPGMYV